MTRDDSQIAAWFVGSAIVIGLILGWALSQIKPITAKDCIVGAHPAIVLEQCAAVQK